MFIPVSAYGWLRRAVRALCMKRACPAVGSTVSLIRADHETPRYFSDRVARLGDPRDRVPLERIAEPSPAHYTLLASKSAKKAFKILGALQIAHPLCQVHDRSVAAHQPLSDDQGAALIAVGRAAFSQTHAVLLTSAAAVIMALAAAVWIALSAGRQFADATPH